MSPSVTSFKVLDGYKVRLVFNDDTQGIVDIKTYIWGEAFEELKDLNYFRKVKLNREIGTLEWPNGTDIAPESLYEQCKLETPF